MKIKFGSGDLSFLIIFGAWFVFYYNGIIDKVIIRIEVLPVWIIFLLAALFFAYLIVRSAITIKPYDIAVVFLFISLIPSMYYNFGAYSFSILSLLFSVLLSIKCKRVWSITSSQKQVIVNVGFVTAVSALAMFAYFSLYDRPVWGVDSIRPGYGYAVDRGVLLRLVGFSEDPNFFVIGSLFPLLICLSDKNIKYRTITICLLGLAMVLTFSRSGLLTVVASISSLYLFKLKMHHLKFVIPLALAAISVFFVATTTIDDLKTNEKVEVDRGFESGMLSRSNLLVVLLDKEDIKFFGNGLGISKEMIGIHSHNTFFDFLFEGGVIPFIIFTGIALSYSYVAITRPNIVRAYGVGVIIGSLAVSIAFQPLLALVILLGSRYVERQDLSGTK